MKTTDYYQKYVLAIVSFAILLVAATHGGVEWDGRDKINFDLDAIRDDGLLGPPDGLVVVDYEFCVPHGKEDEVRKLDPSVRVHGRSQGRIGCDPETHALCIGNTHQKGWREKLLALARLEYIREIRRCDWE